MRSGVFVPFGVTASLLIASAAHAQGMSIEKCTGNFEEAQLKEKRGKLVDAEQLYAACADPKCPAMIRSDCSARRDEMLRRIPTITVVVRDASGNDLTAYVEIDGKPVTDRAHAQPIDPGEHVIDYRPEGKKPAKHEITVVEGEKARVISITARNGEEAQPSKPGAEQSPAPPPGSQSKSGSIVVPVIVGSVGALALVTGVLYQVLANNEDDEARQLAAQAEDLDTPAINRPAFQSAADSHRNAAKTNQVIAIGFGIGGLVLIGTAVVLYVVNRPSPAKSAFTPLLGPGFAGMGYGLRF